MHSVIQLLIISLIRIQRTSDGVLIHSDPNTRTLSAHFEGDFFIEVKFVQSAFPSGRRLERQFFARNDTLLVARDLLGKLLVVPTRSGRRVSGMIVETEAYLGVRDKAAHSFGGRRTARNEVTYAEGGHVYVFFVYGMYFQLNLVTGVEDDPCVVLIRAVEPVEGIAAMRRRRGLAKDTALTSGPGKLCIAMGITRALNGEDLVTGRKIWVEEYRFADKPEIATGPRIGIDYAEEFADVPWRFWLKGNPFVSRK